MKIFPIFVSLMIGLGIPQISNSKNTVPEGCGLSSYQACHQHTVRGSDFFMKKIKIESATYGTHYALVDDDDFELVKKYRWNLKPIKPYKGEKAKKFYAIHSYHYGKKRYTSFMMQQKNIMT